MTAPPIADGAVLVGTDGRIVAVGPDHSVPRPEGIPAVHLPGAALVPGLVNAHTHLELTGFDGVLPEEEFTEWIAHLRQLKAGRSAAEFFTAACQGVRDCWAAGVTTLADTGDTGAAMRALHHLGGSGICYQEVFGPDPDQCAGSMAWLEQRLGELAPLAGPRLRLGVSPHAPYSVSAPLYRAVAVLASQGGLPIAVHLAESGAETGLVVTGDGAFADAWRARGIPVPAAARSAVAHVDACGVLGPATLAIHVVQADAVDLAMLARRGVAVAHCPLSNRRHRHGEAPLNGLLRAGIRVGVGTDSVASVGRLDLLAEARTARILGWLDAAEALALCTWRAAEALGLGGEVGALAAGCWGDLAAIALREAAPADVVESVLASGTGDVLRTWLAGREVYRRPDHPLSLLGDSLPTGA
jgi:5-methylthioadenosine/S-adenosylhomocysteine deaminase